MPGRMLPRYPGLAEQALARRHVVDGEERLILHDTGTGRLLVLGPREWGLLSCADGTRDLDGIVRAGAKLGAYARAPVLQAFLEQLHAAGLIVDGEGEADAAPGPESDAPMSASAAHPLEALPDFSLRCDGSGSCCRIYPTVTFSAVEVARARAALPAVLDGGARPERAFLPERGAGPCGGAAVAMVDGRCAYLASSGRCGVQEVAGAAAKPAGCRLFPAIFVDDGESVRVSVAVECACVLASVGHGDGSALLPPAARVRGDLDPAVHVAALPARIAVREGVTAPRVEFLAWSRCVAAASASVEVPAVFWALADAIDAAGLDVGAARAALAPVAPVRGSLTAEALRPWLAALAVRARRRVEEDARWRSERDLSRLATRWLADAAAALLDSNALPGAGADTARSEAFYLRAMIHGHQLVAGEEPLARALRGRAARLVVARAMALGVAGGIDDPAGAHPLALVEALLRGHGLGAYVHDLP